MSVVAPAEIGIRAGQTDSDEPAAEFPSILTGAEIKRFSELRPPRFFVALGADVVIILLAILISERLGGLPLYLAAVIVIGSRLHALAILMHEATHYRATPTRWLNDMVGEALALPVLIKMQDYRQTHFAHHRHVNTEDDADWVRKLGDTDFAFPKSSFEIGLMLLPFALGVKFFILLRKFKQQSSKYSKSGVRPSKLAVIRSVAYLVVFSASILLNFWAMLLFYWIVPLLTSSMVFFHIRSVAEHFAIKSDHAFNRTRTVISPFWEAWLLAPHNINYHLEHHLYPSVPFYRLPELHDRAMASDEYRAKAHVTRGYLTGLLQECRSHNRPEEPSIAGA
jgi:fatty acid desaturase